MKQESRKTIKNLASVSFTLDWRRRPVNPNEHVLLGDEYFRCFISLKSIQIFDLKVLGTCDCITRSNFLAYWGFHMFAFVLKPNQTVKCSLTLVLEQQLSRWPRPSRQFIAGLTYRNRHPYTPVHPSGQFGGVACPPQSKHRSLGGSWNIERSPCWQGEHANWKNMGKVGKQRYKAHCTSMAFKTW